MLVLKNLQTLGIAKTNLKIQNLIENYNRTFQRTRRELFLFLRGEAEAPDVNTVKLSIENLNYLLSNILLQNEIINNLNAPPIRQAIDTLNDRITRFNNDPRILGNDRINNIIPPPPPRLNPPPVVPPQIPGGGNTWWETAGQVGMVGGGVAVFATTLGVTKMSEKTAEKVVGAAARKFIVKYSSGLFFSSGVSVATGVGWAYTRRPRP